MKLNYRLSLLCLLMFLFQQTFSNLDSLKKQYAVQTGKNHIETGLQIIDSLEEDPDEQLKFALALLKTAKETVPNSMSQAWVNRAISDIYLSLDSIEQSNQQLFIALEVSESMPKPDTIFVADVYNELGLNYIELGDNVTAQKFLNSSLSLFEKTGRVEDIANVKSDLAIVFHSQGKYPEAISLFNEVYEMDLKAGNKRDQSSSLNNIGRMYVDWKKYDIGLEYYLRSIPLLDTISDVEILAVRYNNIGMVYQLMGNHREAISWFEKARIINERENNSIKLGIRYCNIGNSYLALKDYPNARKNLEKSVAIFENSNMFSRISKVYGSLGSLYQLEGNLVKAEYYLILSLNMAEKGENIPEMSISYSKLYQFYKQTGNFRKALAFYEKHTAAKDSIYNLQASKQIEELEAQYQNEKKEAEIVRLEKENELKVKELVFKNRQRNWAIAGLTVLLLVSIIMYFLFSTVRRQKTELARQYSELDRLNKTLNRLFAIISHDLRNATAAYQSSAKVIAHYLDKGQPEKLLPIAAEINANAGNLSSMLENLLQWSVIQMKGIVPKPETLALAEEIEKTTCLFKADVEKKGNKIITNVETDHKIYCDRESFSIILRNLIGNANKFTSKGEMTIASKKDGPSMILTVSDTGCGMTETMITEIFNSYKENVRNGTVGEKGTGLGLMMVKEHVEKNKGSIKVESEEGKGTTFIVTLPSYN